MVPASRLPTMSIGTAIKHLRELRGWSQEELAHRAGTAAPNICRIEAEKHGPSIGLLGKLAVAFELRSYQLMALAEGVDLPDIPQDYIEGEALLLRLYRELPEEQQVLILGVVREFMRK